MSAEQCRTPENLAELLSSTTLKGDKVFRGVARATPQFSTPQKSLLVLSRSAHHLGERSWVGYPQKIGIAAVVEMVEELLDAAAGSDVGYGGGGMLRSNAFRDSAYKSR